MFLLFVAVVGGTGCGGGGSSDSSSYNGGEEYTEDPTTTPTPKSGELAQSEVEDVLGHLAIKYQGGDNPNYVTNNLELPINAENIENVEDVTITWTSDNINVIEVSSASESSGTISGIVHRNKEKNESVALTVKVEKGVAVANKTFALTVIRERSKSIEDAKADIQIIGVNEIRTMNAGNEDLQITYNADRDRITDIDGKYTDITISNADDALDAVQSLHGILGISDPYTELTPSVITSDMYGAEYTFAQVYNGVAVLGRNMTVSTNSKGEGDFIASSVVPSSLLANADLTFNYTQEQVENSVKERYDDGIDVRKGTERAIFSLFEYENSPVPVYVVSVYGNDDSGNYIDENVFVNALTNDVIFTSPNIHDADIIEYRTADDELTNLTHTQRTFPVVPLSILGNTYYIMKDPETKVEAYNREIGIFDGRYNHVSFGEHDEQQVSAYANMIDVMKWWKASFDRDSLDGKGGRVKLVTHRKGGTDNAYWNGQIIAVYDPSEDARSCAAAVDVLAHESTHAVFEYELAASGLKNFLYVCSVDKTTGDGPATGAINEGYADIFGCLMTGKWQHSLNVHADGTYERNIANPSDSAALQNGKGYGNAPSTISEVYCPTAYIMLFGLGNAPDHGGVHINSSIVSYPAYLMYNDYHFSMPDLARLWYKSMRMGYSGTSSFKTVRTCVVRAARKLGMSSDEIMKIKLSFAQVGIKPESISLHGNVSKYGGGALSGVEVKATPSNPTYLEQTTITDALGNFSFDVSVGIYTIEISHAGYVPFTAIKQAEEGFSNSLNISLVSPTGMQPSKINGTVRDALTSYALGNGELKIWKGWNVHTGETVAEAVVNEDGTYELPLFAGYYTAEFSKEGYATTLVNSFVISSDETLNRDIILPPIDDKYRVTLQWDRKPQFLDSHLKGPITDGVNTYGEFHVRWNHKVDYDTSGNVIAMIEQNDTRSYGFETITFEMKPFEKFEYFVHWWSRDYTTTWRETHAVVNLYKGSQLINTYTVPPIDENGYWKSWRVFDIIDGLDPIEPNSDEIIVTNIPENDNY